MKSAILVVLCILVPIDTIGVVAAESLPVWGLQIYKLENYILFALNTAYFGLFYYDLKFVSLEFNYKSETKEFKLLNGSTF
jgi:hypothetical protein